MARNSTDPPVLVPYATGQRGSKNRQGAQNVEPLSLMAIAHNAPKKEKETDFTKSETPQGASPLKTTEAGRNSNKPFM